MRLLATSWHAGQDGRNRLDDTKDPLATTQRRGGERIRQTEVRNEGGSTDWHPGTVMKSIRENRVIEFCKPIIYDWNEPVVI